MQQRGYQGVQHKRANPIKLADMRQHKVRFDATIWYLLLLSASASLPSGAIRR
jgi:hypothetical protein